MKKQEIQKRLWEFRELCLSHVYSEPDSRLHQNVMDQMIPAFVEQNNINPESSVIDIGCGQGYGMTKFRDMGFESVEGVTFSDEDAKAARDLGFVVYQEDMSFLPFNDGSYDVLFARHSLEHSPYPLLTLLEFHRILHNDGVAYIEMPSPKCARVLENYDNHYSIMGPRQWSALMSRAGFSVKTGEIDFEISNTDTGETVGQEVYEWYILRKI